MKRIVLAYGGDLLSSTALLRLSRENVEVVTLSVDVGQGLDLATTRERAVRLGALRAHVIDVREEFARDYVLPALQAGAFGLDLSLSSSVARGMLARRLVDVARMESAAGVAHAARPGSRSERVIEVSVAQLDPSLEIVAPLRSAWPSGAELTEVGRVADLPLANAATPDADANLWTRVIHFPDGSDQRAAFLLTRSVEDAPDTPAVLDVTFERGVPVRVNGLDMSLIELVESIETIAGAHAVGRAAGPDGTTVVEAPAAAVLAIAHRELETAALGTDLAVFKSQLALQYIAYLGAGGWFADAKAALDTFVRLTQRRVDGTVRMRLLKGNCVVVERRLMNNDGDPVRTPRAVA